MLELMSILWTLRKYVDSIQHREEDAQRHRDRQAPRQRIGEGGAKAPLAEHRTPAKRMRACRVCGHRSATDDFCPLCLAETMEVLPPDGEST